MSDTEQKIKIRAARLEDLQPLIRLHFETYYKRFFCEKMTGRDGKPYGGLLGKEFPQLKQGQSFENFSDYWKNFLPQTFPGNPCKKGYCFVATIPLNGTEKLIGFVKGMDSGPDSALKNEMLPALPNTPAEQIGELGSIYVDFDYQQSMAGRLLTQQCARYLQAIDKDVMLTRAYYKNDSPFFFMKLGAEQAGPCRIPVSYYDYNKKDHPEKSVDIPGLLLIWKHAAMSALASADITKLGKGDCIKAETENTSSAPDLRLS